MLGLHERVFTVCPWVVETILSPSSLNLFSWIMVQIAKHLMPPVTLSLLKEPANEYVAYQWNLIFAMKKVTSLGQDPLQLLGISCKILKSVETGILWTCLKGLVLSLHGLPLDPKHQNRNSIKSKLLGWPVTGTTMSCSFSPRSLILWEKILVFLLFLANLDFGRFALVSDIRHHRK